MNNPQPLAHSDGADDVDPRRARSRNRLLDAAAALLTSGGIEAVTVDAVTKASKVAKTTLYRHFTSSSQPPRPPSNGYFPKSNHCHPPKDCCANNSSNS